MNEQDYGHQPVLYEEVLNALNIHASGFYVDGTFGRGGHAAGILARLDSDGRLLAIDQDPQAVAAARERFAAEPRFEIVHGNFAELKTLVSQRQQQGKVDGILLDIGVSSPQLDEAERGFSFIKSGPLDMRMNPQAGESAADWLSHAGEKEIADVLWRFGEEKFSRRIARAIVQARNEGKALTTTDDLVQLIETSVPRKEKHKHPATRSFQAIRIFINRELEVLEQGLEAAVDVLAPGGRLVVISFHSLEDRIVKRFMRDKSRAEKLPRDLPVMDADIKVDFKVIGKAVKPGAAEIEANPRCRSSVMRTLEKKI